MSGWQRKWRAWGLVALGALALLLFGATLGVSVAEENDGFCATCHLNPERTYVARAERVAQDYEAAMGTGASGEALWRAGRDAARDLAGSHRAAALNCVACHRGDNGPADRALALTLGARNTLLYLTGQFDPDHSGVERPGLLEASCLRCHVEQPSLGAVELGAENPVTVDSFENHFHVYLFDPVYAGETAISCVDCHPSHLEIPPIIPFFIDEEGVVLPACVQCHIDVEKGPVDL